MIYPDPVAAADMLRESIRTKLGFTVNIGVSENKLLAKMASELEKPDKTHTLFRDEIASKMWPLPIEELFMVGRKTALALRQCGITTIGELAHTAPDILIRRFKNARGLMLHAYANGTDTSEVAPHAPTPKSIGNSTTLSSDIASAERRAPCAAFPLRNGRRAHAAQRPGRRRRQRRHQNERLPLFFQAGKDACAHADHGRNILRPQRACLTACGRANTYAISASRSATYPAKPHASRRFSTI